MIQSASRPVIARQPSWHVVVPVKDAAVGKSRLAQALFRAGHHGNVEVLARAIARDTLEVLCHVVDPARVVLVTADGVMGPEWQRRGVLVVGDPAGGLNAAVAAGLAQVPPDEAVAVLLGDLPALRPEDLTAALAAAARQAHSVVPDLDGTGTVLRATGGRPAGEGTLAATPHFIPRFGPGSAAAHAADGATVLELDLPRLRTDVDDLESLRGAAALGLGPCTTRALTDLDLLGWTHAGDRARL